MSRRSRTMSLSSVARGPPFAQHGAEYLGPRPVRRSAALLPTSAPHDGQAACSPHLADRPSEMGLADPASPSSRNSWPPPSATASTPTVKTPSSRPRPTRDALDPEAIIAIPLDPACESAASSSTVREVYAWSPPPHSPPWGYDSASTQRSSPRGADVDQGSFPTAAVRVTGSPSTSHNTAALGPCQRIASDSFDAGPVTRR